MTRSLLMIAFLTLSAPVMAQSPLERLREQIDDTVERWRAEGNIERRMMMGELRGRLSRRPAPPDWTARSHGAGRLERGPGGVPILHLRGTPEEMGEQHGRLLKREIQALTAYMRNFVGPDQLDACRARARELFLAATPDDLRREATALAAAAELPLDDVLFAQWMTDLYRVFACTCVGSPSDEGPLLARNLDFPGQGYLAEYSLVVVARPAGKRAFVSVSWPGLVGVLSGMNDGVALAVMVVHETTGARAGVPFQLAFRRALEQAGDAAGVEAALRAMPLTVTNNLMVVDRGGAARVLELHPDRIQARAGDAQGRVVSTNHFLRSPEPWRPSLTHISSLTRYRRAADVTRKEQGPLTVDRAREALRRSASQLTQQSMLFFPARGEVEVALRARPPAPEGRWVRLRASELLGAP